MPAQSQGDGQIKHVGPCYIFKSRYQIYIYMCVFRDTICKKGMSSNMIDTHLAKALFKSAPNPAKCDANMLGQPVDD